MTRKERGGGDSVQAEIERLTSFVDSSKGRVIEAIAQERVLKRSEDFNKDIYGCCTSRTKKRVSPCRPIFKGHCGLDAEEHQTWRWLSRGQLKKETDGLITTAQDQALRTKTIKSITPCPTPMKYSWILLWFY